MNLTEANEIAKLCYWIIGSLGWMMGIICMVKYLFERKK